MKCCTDVQEKLLYKKISVRCTRVDNLSYIPHITRLLTVFAKTEKFRLNLCFETSEQSVQTANDYSKAILQAFRLTLPLYIFKLVLYCNSIIISNYTAKKMKFSIKDFFSKCEQIRRNPQIWSHLLKKSLMEKFISRAAPNQVLLNKKQRECS